jgi:hypothetical protein
MSMSMSTHVVGFRKPDDNKFQKYAKIWKSCVEAGVGVPEEVFDYFNGEDPDENGMEVGIENTDAVKIYKEDYYDGFEVDVTKLPKDVHIIRFYNSY